MTHAATLPASVIGGALNMLQGCAEARAGDRVLVVHEEGGQHFYDRASVAAVMRVAHQMRADPRSLEIPFSANVGPIPAPLHVAMAQADRTIFMARIGDQLRFGRDLGAQATVCYALDADMLGSPYGTAEHGGMLALKQAVNTALNAAGTIRVTCPAGTDFSGPGRAVLPEDVSIRRFPMSVCTPISATDFSGIVALPGFLVGTGSHYYEPYGVSYEGELLARFERGRLTGFEGRAAAVALADAHYDHVASLFRLDRNCVHSWHVGIHPGCAFPVPAAENFRRWSGGAFGNPRLLHFHTCGNYPPGEISWNVLDPTVDVDGVRIWDRGVLDPAKLPGGQAILDDYPYMRAAFASPAREVGVN